MTIGNIAFLCMSMCTTINILRLYTALNSVKMANLLFIETRAFLEGADKVVIPFGIWEHNEGISRYRNRVKAVCGSKSCGHIVGDVEID